MNETGTSELRIFADTSDIVPFWARLPRFFLYPLRLGSLALIALSMALAYVAQLTHFVFPLLALISIGFVRYGYAVLESTARGRSSNQPLFGEDGVDSAWRPYKQWVVFVLIAVGTAIAAV